MVFTHLHLHSQYSLQDRLCNIEQTINKVREFKMKAVALTDHDGMYRTILKIEKEILASMSVCTSFQYIGIKYPGIYYLDNFILETTSLNRSNPVSKISTINSKSRTNRL